MRGKTNRFPPHCCFRSSGSDHHVDDFARYDDGLLDRFAGRVFLQLRIGQYGGLDFAGRSAQRKYPDCVIDPAGLEDIMLLYSKGTQGRRRERP